LGEAAHSDQASVESSAFLHLRRGGDMLLREHDCLADVLFTSGQAENNDYGERNRERPQRETESAMARPLHPWHKAPAPKSWKHRLRSRASCATNYLTPLCETSRQFN
jgi:hypothetical protein